MTDEIDEEGNVELEPGWRRALRTFFEVPFGVGSTVPIEWLERELGAPHFEEGTADEAKAASFRWLRQWSRFRDALLDRHQLAIVYDRDLSAYRVLTPSEHLRYTSDEGERRLRLAARFVATNLSNVRVEALTDRERAEHADRLAHMAALKSFMRKQLK